MHKSILLLIALVSLHARSKIFEDTIEHTIFNSSDQVRVEHKEIQQHKADGLKSALSTQANISISGTPIQKNSVYIRGADPGHILFTLDGLPVYDAASAQRHLDMDSFNVRNIKSLNIIKGSQNILYGGHAMGGVIALKTQPNPTPYIFTQMGSSQHISVGGGYSYNIKKSQLQMDYIYTKNNNKSPVKDSEQSYTSNKQKLNMVFYPQNSWMKYFRMGHLKEDSYLPNTHRITYQIEDTNEFLFKNTQYNISSGLNLNSLTQNMELALGLQHNNRSYYNPINSTNSTLNDQDYIGQALQLRGHKKFKLKSNSKILVGTSYTNEHFIYDKVKVNQVDDTNDIYGLFFKGDHWIQKNTELEWGLRQDFWNNHHSEWTYQLGFVFYEKLRIERSSGLKIPSMFQLYSRFGHLDLKPEKADNHLVSLNHNITPNQALGVSLFYNKYSQLIIVTGSPLQYDNVEESRVRGAEISYQWKFNDLHQASFIYGYQEPLDITNDQWLLRRALNSSSFKYNYSKSPLKYNFEINHLGSRIDSSGSTSTVKLDPVIIANIYGSYQYSKSLNIYGKVNNLFNKTYEMTYSNYKKGLDFKLGFEMSF